MSPSGRERKGVREAVDRRSSRTRRSIDAAFLGLLQRHTYEGVAVSDIVREADVGRATFYEHYASKDDLLRTQLRQVSRHLLRVDAAAGGLLDATSVFLHVRDVPVLYRLVAGRSANARSLRILHEVLEARTAELLADRLSAGASLRSPFTPPVTSRLIVANLGALLAWWTENGLQESAQEMQTLFHACVGSMVVPALPPGSAAPRPHSS